MGIEWKVIKTSGFDYGSTRYYIPGVCTNIQDEETANLLAAAPDLLKELESLLQIAIGYASEARKESEETCSKYPWAQRAFAAISKAEGKD